MTTSMDYLPRLVEIAAGTPTCRPLRSFLSRATPRQGTRPSRTSVGSQTRKDRQALSERPGREPSTLRNLPHRQPQSQVGAYATQCVIPDARFRARLIGARSLRHGHSAFSSGHFGDLGRGLWSARFGCVVAEASRSSVFGFYGCGRRPRSRSRTLGSAVRRLSVGSSLPVLIEAAEWSRRVSRRTSESKGNERRSFSCMGVGAVGQCELWRDRVARRGRPGVVSMRPRPKAST
jgi:hypothetical protein